MKTILGLACFIPMLSMIIMGIIYAYKDLREVLSVSEVLRGAILLALFLSSLFIFVVFFIKGMDILFK